MIIGIISDTHDLLQTTDVAFEFFAQQGVECIIHCGDWKTPATLNHFIHRAHRYTVPVKAVLGNNDCDVAAMLALGYNASDFELREGVFEFTLDDIPCAIYHGHHAPTLRHVKENDAYRIVFLGHTHKPRIDQINSKLIINPGSVAFSIPRSKAFTPTVAILDTETVTAEIHPLVIA